MKLNEIKKFYETYTKGTYIHIEMESDVKLPKDLSTHSLKKYSVGKVKTGINYVNTKKFKEKGVEAQGLKGNQKFIIFPYLLECTNKNGEHSYQVNLFIDSNCHMDVRYELDGKDVDKQWLLDNGYIKPSKPLLDNVFHKKIDGIISMSQIKA